MKYFGITIYIIMTEYIKINEKVITWIQRTIQVSNVNSTEEAIKKVIQCYGNNKDPQYYDKDIELFDSEEIYECEESLSPEDNKGEATLEVTFDGKVVWDNINGSYNSLRQ